MISRKIFIPYGILNFDIRALNFELIAYPVPLWTKVRIIGGKTAVWRFFEARTLFLGIPGNYLTLSSGRCMVKTV